ncbi:PKD domain-containing protein [Nocardioides sp. J2M5]|uniref:PKD domain-containing protein n=1 Tax=Nocardioides palaemonis TaxID=2829810 RepID=UPI001BA7FC42|nr:PKD domain-containing protein [Nocardioides palaemonis]MBS2936601.1 PKD domain-containing protein [Nocardioides palaemonis]
MGRARDCLASVLVGVLALTLADPVGSSGASAAAVQPVLVGSEPLGFVAGVDAGGSVQVVVAASGRTTAVWVEEASRQVVSRTRDAGGAWEAAVAVSRPFASAAQVDVGIDLAGRVTAVWTDSPVSRSSVWTASSADGSTWTEPTFLGVGSGGVSLAVAHDGTAIAVWADTDIEAGVEVVEAAVRRGSRAWSEAESLGEAAEVGRPAVAVNPLTGEGTTVWSDGALRASRWAGATGWSPMAPAPLTPSGPPGGAVAELDVAVDGTGRTTAVRTEAGDAFVFEALAGAPWGAGQRLTATTGFEFGFRRPRIATNVAGDAVVAWDWTLLDAQVVFVASRTADGAWPAATRLRPGFDGYGRQIAATVDDAGLATVAWTNDYSGHVQAQVGEPWPEPVLIGPERFAQLGGPKPLALAAPVAAGEGETVLVRTRPDPVRLTGLGTQALALAFDSHGPRVTSFSVPSSGRVGEAVVVEARAVDSWSAVTSYAWDFGDGSTASGTSTAHAYAEPGTYPVTLVVTDAVGNNTRRTSTTTISRAAVSTAAAPRLTTFRLARRRIAATGTGTTGPLARRTSLLVGLTAPATLRLVVTSRSRHRVDGRWRPIRVMLRRQLPAGVSRITLRARLDGTVLRPDDYRVVGRARSEAGASQRRTVRLVVVRSRR